MINRNNVSKNIKIGRNVCERILSKRASLVVDYFDRPVFPIYKYMHRRDLKYIFEDETIKIGTLYGYSDQDSIGGQADPNEIKTEAQHITIDDSGSEKNKRVIENLYALGLADIRPGAIDTYIGGAIVHRSNIYISCYSYTYSKHEMLEWNKKEGYDCCLEIFDAIQFVRYIQQADYNFQRKLSFNDKIYAGGGLIDDVVYEKFPFDLDICDFTYFSFHKDRDVFSWQNEIRVSWPAKISCETKPFIMNVPGLSRIVRPIE